MDYIKSMVIVLKDSWRLEACVTTQMRSNANVIYQHLEKFDKEKKSQSVRQDLNPLYSVPCIRAQPLGHHRCCCWQPLFQLFYRQTLHNPAPPTLTLLTIRNLSPDLPAPPIHNYRPAITAVYVPAYHERVGIAFALLHGLIWEKGYVHCW